MRFLVKEKKETERNWDNKAVSKVQEPPKDDVASYLVFCFTFNSKTKFGIRMPKEEKTLILGEKKITQKNKNRVDDLMRIPGIRKCYSCQ